jgi:hypothetical protein
MAVIISGVVGTVGMTYEAKSYTPSPSYAKCVSFVINNTHGSQNIIISWDDGNTDHFTLFPRTARAFPYPLGGFQIKGSGAGTNYEINWIVEK